MSKLHIANRDCGDAVMEKVEFSGSNLSGIWKSDTVYVVYSYDWYPLWACIDGKWYGHKSKYSVSTSKQRVQSTPASCDGEVMILPTVDKLKAIIQLTLQGITPMDDAAQSDYDERF